ncbi:hypothetical protein [Nocardia donostiensis]|uniref:DUF8020 domain-containing protein n=1 Tax=Nocardia donostiensis TaxID=1538463 RepID=A0A1W0BPB4_9NOCA|nr:hypothetical protein [Nocardia donostiensis]ONM47592.1 hypothetical protein B0T46_17000 [Nocardia donostiensis]OQS15063.1 hypothetical protein B0T36_10300 [Nocardia donostiensis]OQS24236.1 hypothetical protein B0T44_01035 [Nocardia donostiensis]
MKFGKFSAVACMAIAAIGITAGTANAQPAAANEDITTSGVQQGIAYETTLSGDAKTVTTTVDAGAFEITDNGATVSLIAANGAEISELPLTFQVAGRSIPIAHEIGDNGRSLTLTPEVSAGDIAELKDISSFDRFMDQANKNILGMIAGGVLGGFIGSLLGLGIFSIITGPLGMVAGALVGGSIQGGPAFTDALMALINGQP